jgi:hypothetical protein
VARPRVVTRIVIYIIERPHNQKIMKENNEKLSEIVSRTGDQVVGFQNIFYVEENPQSNN